MRQPSILQSEKLSPRIEPNTFQVFDREHLNGAEIDILERCKNQALYFFMCVLAPLTEGFDQVVGLGSNLLPIGEHETILVVAVEADDLALGLQLRPGLFQQEIYEQPVSDAPETDRIADLPAGVELLVEVLCTVDWDDHSRSTRADELHCEIKGPIERFDLYEVAIERNSVPSNTRLSAAALAPGTEQLLGLFGKRLPEPGGDSKAFRGSVDCGKVCQAGRCVPSLPEEIDEVLGHVVAEQQKRNELIGLACVEVVEKNTARPAHGWLSEFLVSLAHGLILAKSLDRRFGLFPSATLSVKSCRKTCQDCNKVVHKVGRLVLGTVDDLDPEWTNGLEPGEPEACEPVFVLDEQNVKVAFGEKPMKLLSLIVDAAAEFFDDADDGPPLGFSVSPEPICLTGEGRLVLATGLPAVNGAAATKGWCLTDLRLEPGNRNESVSSRGNDRRNCSGIREALGVPKANPKCFCGYSKLDASIHRSTMSHDVAEVKD